MSLSGRARKTGTSRRRPKRRPAVDLPGDWGEELTSTERKRRKITFRARMGQWAQQRHIEDLVARGPKLLLRVLNLAHDVFRRREFSESDVGALPDEQHRRLQHAFFPNRLPYDLGEPRLRAPLWIALNSVREAVDCIIADRDPGCERARDIVKQDLHGLIGQCDHATRLMQSALRDALKEVRPKITDERTLGYLSDLRKRMANRGDLDAAEDWMTFLYHEGETFRPVVRRAVLAWHFELAVDLLLAFQKLPAAWVAVIRKCQYQDCSTPYCLDRSASGRKRHCSAKHRVYHGRLKASSG